MLRILVAALAVVLFWLVGACATTGTGAAGNTSAEQLANLADEIGVSDIRFLQAEILWDKGYAEELGYKTKLDYLDTIPLVPKFSSETEQRFPLLVLVDGRVMSPCACSHILEYCYGMEANIPLRCGNSKNPKEPNIDRYPGVQGPEVYWIRVQDGRKNQGISPEDAVRAFANDEVPLTAREGLAVYAQYPGVVKGHHMFLPGSDHVCYDTHFILQLGEWKGKLSLDHAPINSGVLVTFGTPSRAK